MPRPVPFKNEVFVAKAKLENMVHNIKSDYNQYNSDYNLYNDDYSGSGFDDYNQESYENPAKEEERQRKAVSQVLLGLSELVEEVSQLKQRNL